MTAFHQQSLHDLLQITKEACDVIAPLVHSFYTAINGETAKLKADASVFTIADGIVQHLLRDHLFAGGKFANIVGEEDESNINIVDRPYRVDDLEVPSDFLDQVDAVRVAVVELAQRVNGQSFLNLTVFIDPIDGTREFSTGLGEQCSICIGFSDPAGIPVSGLVYRPLTQPPTWAAGAASEGCVLGLLDHAATPNPRGLLTSNGSISPFIVALMNELNFVRVPSGGAGNKMLMLLEGKGGAYIQDRGVSRWDTAGAQAVLDAYGGKLSKLTSFVARKEFSSYTYLKSALNLDFEPGTAALTPYNAQDKKSVKKGETVLATDPASVKPYSNLSGLYAVSAACIGQEDLFFDAIQRARVVSEPSYD